MIPHKLPPITDKIFGEIADLDKFKKFVVTEYKYDAEQMAAFVPRFSDDLFHDAHQAYMWDVERLDGNMKTTPDHSPDHFKRAGLLAYWLRRRSPILRWDKYMDMDDCNLDDAQKKWREFIFNYGREFHAFSLGYRICWSMEWNKEQESPMPKVISEKRLTHICYFMKYKSVSPHAMGLIYESLFPE
ncbi:MAG: hypothetical protein HAW59_06540 [Betaproteobacteria bacterium]|nr:hypothetical protein [Betaproteobacteria bacterium]